MESKSSRSFKNLLSAIFKGFATSILGFIITPYLIRYVGDEQFGLFKLIIDWLSNIWIFDLGVSGAFLAIAAINLKTANKKELFRDGFIKYLSALPLMLLACISFYIITRFIVDLKSVSVIDYTISFFIISLTFIFYPLNTFRQYFEVSERLSFINKVTIIQLVLTNIFSLLFAYLGMGLIGLSLSYTLFIGLGFIYIYAVSSKELDLSLKDIFKGEGRYIDQIKGQGKNFLFINISQKISFLADNTIIAYFFNASMIVPFFISSRLSSLFQGQVQSITYSSWASLIDFYNNGDRTIFLSRFKELIKGNLVLSFCCLSIIWLLNKDFVSLWIGSNYFIDQYFSIIVALLAFINILNFFLGNVLSGTGHVSKQSNAYIYTGIINLFFSILLTVYIGLHGPVLSSLITMFFLLVYKCVLLKRIYHIGYFEQFILFFPVLCITTIVIWSYSSLLTFYPITNWWILILHAFFIGFLQLILSLAICLSHHERQVWISRLKRVLKL